MMLQIICTQVMVQTQKLAKITNIKFCLIFAAFRCGKSIFMFYFLDVLLSVK